MSFSVKPYHSTQLLTWNQFVATAKNATFLFNRDFMDYHKDRFNDFSLMIYKNEKLFALLPAHLIDDKLYAHKGLTYGSFILQESATLLDAIEAIKQTLKYLLDKGIKTIEIKVIPNFYNTLPSDELCYALFRAQAKLLKRDVLMVIDYAHQLPFKKNRREGINKAKRNDLTLKIDQNYEGFWNEVLIPNLSKKHQVSPVHSLEEIKLLAQKFPDHIKQLSIYKNQQIVAGTTLFLTKTTVHPQYVSGNTNKNAYGSLDLAYFHAINDFKKGRRYFDYNISSEENGKVLNKGLLFWKETSGARAYTADTYEVETRNYEFLNIEVK